MKAPPVRPRAPLAARRLPPAVETALERLGECGEARVRAMFGGHGLYLDDLFVAIVAEGRLYLKADALSAPRFAEAGGEAFVYTARIGEAPLTMGYWSVPDEALEQPGGLAVWARLAQEAALRARKDKPGLGPISPDRRGRSR